MTQSEKIKLCEKYGIEYDAGCRMALAEEMKRVYGAEPLLNQLIQALSNDDALDNLEYIDRMNS